MTTPAVSIITPVFNAGRPLAHTLRSVAAQTLEDWQHVIVDDGSTDPTTARLLEAAGAQARTTVIRTENRGPATARNTAVANARGRYLVFLDADDHLAPEFLAKTVAVLEAEPDVGVVHTWVALVGGHQGVWRTGPFALPDLLARCTIHVTALVRRELFGAVGGFDTPTPAWLSDALYGALSAYDLGPTPMTVRYGRTTYPFGGNIAFRVSAARARGGFSEIIGLRGRHQLLHEETDLCYRLEHAGGIIRYVPDAVVDHQIGTERLSPGWMLRRHYHGGESTAVFVLRNRGVLRAIWRVWWQYAQALATVPYAVRDPIDPKRFARECQRREALGYVACLVRGVARVDDLRRDMTT